MPGVAEPSNTQVAVVTGAARGIGRATALGLARRGFAVAVVDLRVPELEATTTAIGALGASALPLIGDVADFTATQALGARVRERWGRVDVLVNNAGITQPKGLLDISEAEWDRTLAVDLKGAFNWCKAVVPIMLAGGGGRIVNISSVNAHTGGSVAAVSKSAYAAAKAGVLGLTRGLARELAPRITVNAICPGLIATDLTTGLVAEQGPALRGSIPLGRLGTPEDIAEVVAFLATVVPNFITGEVIDVDGGQWVN